jgi:hypothetical protein
MRKPAAVGSLSTAQVNRSAANMPLAIRQMARVILASGREQRGWSDLRANTLAVRGLKHPQVREAKLRWQLHAPTL